ncbi:hypothetical protein KSP40_PGU010337 [Platanthera guangdongensis]|uniref:Uncharacterized protein n=1 Tax=Platanthera guangdongensis TaxID=2320717 RepID=A0ABR2LHQ6_9ASPA
MSSETTTKNFQKQIPPPSSVSPLLVRTNIFLLRRSVFAVAPILCHSHFLYDVIFSFHLIFISYASLVHSTLIHYGVQFFNCVPHVDNNCFLSIRDSINVVDLYVFLWHTLQNLPIKTIQYPFCICLFSPGHRCTLGDLHEVLHSQSGHIVTIKESFKQAIFSLLRLIISVVPGMIPQIPSVLGESMCYLEISILPCLIPQI